MESWKRSLAAAPRAMEELARRLHLDLGELRRVSERFPFRSTPYYLSLIREKGDPIYRQCIPDPAELEPSPDLLDDPLGEEAHAAAPCVVHKYPDRCLLLVSGRCASYCRFCTRKRMFANPPCFSFDRILQGVDYIRRTPAIRDVLVSGGDPLLLEDDDLDAILSAVRSIPHVETVRIGTRAPCVLPNRVTRGLCAMLRRHHPLFINIHFNHPRELTPQSTAACARLADAGIPLGSQTVLLKGVNDDPETMADLMHALLRARVRPYYIFQCDLVGGTAHFRTPLAKGLEIVRSLHGFTSGMAAPTFAIDLPKGGGKIPLLPDYLVGREGDVLTFANYLGEPYTYPDIP